MNQKFSTRQQINLSIIIFAVFTLFSGAVTADNELAGPNELKARSAMILMTKAYPDVQVLREDGRITRLYGSAFSNGSSPEESAENFVYNYADVLGVGYDQLRPESLNKDGVKTQPVMYNQNTGEYKFTLVYYSQFIDGVPVYNADLRLLVRNEPGYPLVLASSSLRNLDGLNMADKASYNNALAEIAVQSDNPSLVEFTAPELTIWGGINNKLEQPTAAFAVVGSSDFPERWQYIINAQNGEVIYKQNLIIFENVNGTVHGMGTPGYAADICASAVDTPMPYSRVNIGSTISYADVNGDYTITNGGTSDVTVTSPVWGQYFRVYNYAGADAELTQVVTPPGPANFMHNSPDAEHTRSEVNAYILANLVRDLVIANNPSYPQVSTQSSFPIYVNRDDGYCPGNAWYDPGDVSINFCSAGGGYPNTSFMSVVYHEYGHHLVDAAGSGQGQYGEGLGDVIAILGSNDSRLGVGFTGNCSVGIRDADNTKQYPCSGTIHDCGQLLSGCIWDARTELMAIYPSSYMDTLALLSVNSILLHSGTEITPQITIDFLTLDDDDADLNNGTPHYDQLCAAFGAHNMDCPEVAEIWFDYTEGIPEVSDPSSGTVFRVVVNSGAATPVAGTGKFYYNVNDHGYMQGTMIETSPNVYQITMPTTSCNDRIDWFVQAQDSNGGTVSDPSGAPIEFYTTIADSEIFEVFADNFNANTGWTVSGTVTDGAWDRGVPAGLGERGDPATDYDGSTYCYLTDNVYGNSDVDGGTTMLTSPTFDLSAGDAKVSYARWYSNTFGAAPNLDSMFVHISNNNGGNWTIVEIVGPVDQANGGWYENSFLVSDYLTPTATMQMRFDVSDLGEGSVVEAALDAFLVKSFRCNDQPVISTSDLSDGTVDNAYSYSIVASGGSGDLTWTDKNGDLVGTGLSLSTDGILSGTPTSTGGISFTARVEDTAANYDEQLFSFTINDHIQIISTSLPEWTVNQAYNANLSSTGGTSPATWSDLNGDLGGTGLALSTDGFITGTPISEGTIGFTAKVEDNVGDADQSALTILINPALAITVVTPPDAIEGTAYNHQLQTTNGTGEVRWEDKFNDLSGTGVALDTAGYIYGIPTDTGTFSFTAVATDFTGSSDEAIFNLVIGPAYLCGDANADLAVNIIDITYIIAYLYNGGPAPLPLDAADVNASGDVNIIDITALIAYLYDSGSEPTCP